MDEVNPKAYPLADAHLTKTILDLMQQVNLFFLISAIRKKVIFLFGISFSKSNLVLGCELQATQKGS